MAKSAFIRIAIALAFAAVGVGGSSAVTLAESNPSGWSGNSDDAGKYLGPEAGATPAPRKSKSATSQAESPVNKAGVKPATTVVSKDGRVFLTHSVPSLTAATSETRVHGKATAAPAVLAMNTKKPGRTTPQPPKEEPGGAQKSAPLTQGPVLEFEPSPQIELNTTGLNANRGAMALGFESTPHIALNGQRATGADFPPPSSQAPAPSQLPGLESPAEPSLPDVRTTESAALANGAATLAAASGSHGIGGAGGGPLSAASSRLVPGTLPTYWAARSRSTLPWYGALAGLLMCAVGMIWIHSLHKRPWQAYTEDWLDGFLWRWHWKNARIIDLRCFCPTCRGEVILSTVASADNPAAASEPQGTWALCPHCKEATCLEMSDVSGTVSRELLHRVTSGEYLETVAASKRRAGVALRGEVQIKTVGGRIL